MPVWRVLILLALTVTTLSSCSPNSQVPGGLLVSSNLTGDWEVFVVDIEDSLARQVTNEIGFDMEGSWSPDGEKIALASSRGLCKDVDVTLLDGNQGDCDLELLIVRPDGSVLAELTDNSRTDDQPSWSPDGSRIAFRSDRTNDVELFVMDADGENVKQLTDSAGEDWTPTWSPDGSLLAFASNRNGNWDLFVMRPDGTEIRQITDGGGQDHWLPAWSPDGSMLAFTGNRDGNWDIFTIRPDGSELQQVVTHPASDSEPVWSPDGSVLAFARKQAGRSYELMMVELSSGQVSDGNVDGFPTDWFEPTKNSD